MDADGKTLLGGFGLDTNFAQIFIEQAWTELPQRTGDKPKARSIAFGGTMMIGGE